MSAKKQKKEYKKETNYNFLHIFLLPIFFLVSLFISYFFTHTIIARANPVSLDYEANGFTQIMQDSNLNNL